MAMFKKTISRVKVLGIRTGEQTKVLATYNTSVYCVLIEYSDGTRALDECEGKAMQQYLPYIDMD